MIAQKPEIELHAEYWPHSHDQKCFWRLWFIALKWVYEHQDCARIGKSTNWLVLPLLLHDCSKTRNWITTWILATFTWSRIGLKPILYTFQTIPGTLRMAKNWWPYKVISFTTPPAWFSKNPTLNCKLNPGHIHMIKSASKSHNL